MPLHAPGLALRVCPLWAVPEMVGGDVLAGAVAAPCTTVVAAEVALVGPTVLVAVTATRIVLPMSAMVTG